MFEKSCHRKPDTLYHFILVSLGFLLAFLPQIAISEWQNFVKAQNFPLPIHGSAQSETMGSLLHQFEQKPYQSFQVIFQKSQNDFASKGQNDVSLLKLQLSSTKDAYLEELTLSVDNFGDINITPELQLYSEKKLLATAPVLEGKAFFNNIHELLGTGQKENFEIKGTISQAASSGNRIRIGFQAPEDLKISDDGKTTLRASNSFPVWGAPISIIGNRIN